MINILLLDDHAVLRGALRRLIDGEPDLCVVAEAATVQEAIHQAMATSPDVALVDLSLGEESGLAAIRALTDLPRPPHVVVLTMHGDKANIVEALAAGAGGYLLKSAPVEDVLRALRTAASGGATLDPKIAAQVLPYIAAAASAQPGGLTPREREVFELLRAGMRNREIAQRLHLSEKTVKHHVGQVLLKLGAPSRRSLRA